MKDPRKSSFLQLDQLPFLQQMSFADNEEAKGRKVVRKYFRAYYPEWKGEISSKRLAYETSIEVKYQN